MHTYTQYRHFHKKTFMFQYFYLFSLQFTKCKHPWYIQRLHTKSNPHTHTHTPTHSDTHNAPSHTHTHTLPNITHTPTHTYTNTYTNTPTHRGHCHIYYSFAANNITSIHSHFAIFRVIVHSQHSKVESLAVLCVNSQCSATVANVFNISLHIHYSFTANSLTSIHSQFSEQMFKINTAKSSLCVNSLYSHCGYFISISHYCLINSLTLHSHCR
jgi:hypothetical protein